MAFFLRKPISNGMPQEPKTWGVAYLRTKREFVREKPKKIAGTRKSWIERNKYYYGKLKSFMQFLIEPQRHVLQIACESGDLLAATEPSYGVGLDVSEDAVKSARQNYPQFHFEVQDPEHLAVNRRFDYVIINGLGDMIDIQRVFLKLRNVITPRTRLIILNYNYLWKPLIKAAEKLRLKVPQPAQNWLSIRDVENLLTLCGYENLKTFHLFLLPKYIPIFSFLFNEVLARCPGIRRLCLLNILVARQAPQDSCPDYTVSVIIPCKNEKGNVAPAVQRIPEMGRHTEIIFCDDKSTDGTADEVRRVQKIFPGKDIKLVQGPGICKALNVWTGFDAAQGDVLMILDADLTTMPEELPYFYNALVEGKGEFINGSRMVYPMEDGAMRPLNVLGNKFFSWVFSYLLEQPIRDTLCGTKVLWRRDYDRMKKLRGSWGAEDLWGDYELLFGAARLHLKIIDLPVHYLDRTYGETKMTKRLHTTWTMLRTCIGALLKLKFQGGHR